MEAAAPAGTYHSHIIQILIRGRELYQTKTEIAQERRSLLRFAKGISNAGFIRAVLSTAGEKVPFRLPCESCACLVPLFGKVPGQGPYDSDLAELLHV